MEWITILPAGAARIFLTLIMQVGKDKDNYKSKKLDSSLCSEWQLILPNPPLRKEGIEWQKMRFWVDPGSSPGHGSEWL